jgi:hypothetical protein
MPCENHQKINWKCDACGKLVTQVDTEIMHNCQPYRPSHPNGWLNLGPYTFCPNHLVVVVIDGKKIIYPR